jgi:hypothetical protein
MATLFHYTMHLKNNSDSHEKTADIHYYDARDHNIKINCTVKENKIGDIHSYELWLADKDVSNKNMVRNFVFHRVNQLQVYIWLQK